MVLGLVSSLVLATAASVAPAPQERQLSVPAQGGARLAATLTLPAGGGSHPGAVLVGGVGPLDRDGGNGQYRQLADALARRGLAVLRYDKRGIGDSSGSALGWLDARGLAADAVAAVRALAAQPGVDGRHLALIGHSQGGMLALWAATRAPVERVVTLASPGIPLDRLPRGSGAPVADLLGRLVGPAAQQATLERDPRRDATRLRVPLMLVHGGADGFVGPLNMRALAGARAEAGKGTRTLLAPGLGHTLRPAEGPVPGYVVDAVAAFASGRGPTAGRMAPSPRGG